MQNYFRITAYHPIENISVIMDSYGKFEKLWQFSAYMVSKGFKIIAVGGEDKFEVGDMPKAEYNAEKVYLQAFENIQVSANNNLITLDSKTYTIL